jgi:hypothetical protein
MTYIKVSWIHSFEDEPIEILSEIDSQRREVRKVERFRNGTVCFAGPAGVSGSTRLSDEPIPPLSGIAHDPQFAPSLITKADFEQGWQLALGAVAA